MGWIALTLSLTVAASTGGATPSLTRDRWLLVQVTETVAELPVVGEARASTTAVMLFDLATEGERLAGDGEICSLHIRSHPDLLRPVLPQSYVDAVGRIPFDARLVREAGVERLENRRTTVVLGATLAQPTREPLPTDPLDPRVVDIDRDGHPGITMHVEGIARAEVYMVTRRFDQLSGMRVDEDRFEGFVLHSQEQTLLGASNPLLRDLPTMRSDVERSRFALTRVSRELRCRDVSGAALDARPSGPAP